MTEETKSSIITWLVVLIIIVIIAAGGWWYISNQNNHAAQPGATAIQSSAKSITSFSFSGLTPQADGVINADNSIDITVPSQVDITNLAPTIVVSAGATVSPGSGVAQNFTTPVTYTVTAQDGSAQTYTVVVTSMSAK